MKKKFTVDGKPAVAQLFGAKLVIRWDGGCAQRDDAQAMDVPDVVNLAWLRAKGFSVDVAKED